MFALRIAVVGLLSSLAGSAFAAHPLVEVTACGQVVPRQAVGFLTADLDCSGYDGQPGAVMLSRSSRLELRGFRLTGGRLTVFCAEWHPNRQGVPRLHSDRCTVDGGGGVISTAEAHGISGEKLTVSNVTVENAGQEGIYATKKARLADVVVTGSAGIGVRIDGPALVTGSTVTGSGENGVTSGRKLRIKDSTVVGNGLDTDACSAPDHCYDLVSVLRPQVIDTQCGTSGGGGHVLGGWGACAND
jgi:hypothetical protein